MDNIPQYRGIPCESDEELHFLFWAFELHNKGFIRSIERGQSISLTEGLDNEFVIKDSKGREVTKRQTILRPSEYTPDYRLIFPNEHFAKFVWSGEGKVEKPLIGKSIGGGIEVFIECKPDFDQNNMTRLFKNNQKFIWDKYKIFINLVKTKEFFEKTFTPAEFLKTRTGKDRKLNYEPRTLDEYLNL